MGTASAGLPVTAGRSAQEESRVRLGHVLGAGILALLAASCRLGDPTDAGSINVYLDLDKTTLPLDEVVTITVTARNVGYDPITLTGPSDCLLHVEVVTNAGQLVWQSNTSCAGNTVTESVAAGESKVQAFTWNGTNQAGARLAAGFYHVRGVARLTGGAYGGPLVSVALE